MCKPQRQGTVTDPDEFSFIDDVPVATSDLAGLEALDSSNGGRLSSAETSFADFRVCRDAHGDGAVDTGEVPTLTFSGVASLGLSGTAVNAASAFDDVAVLATGSYTRTIGATVACDEGWRCEQPCLQVCNITTNALDKAFS